jgi:hypothetical protein
MNTIHITITAMSKPGDKFFPIGDLTMIKAGGNHYECKWTEIGLTKTVVVKDDPSTNVLQKVNQALDTLSSNDKYVVNTHCICPRNVDGCANPICGQIILNQKLTHESGHNAEVRLQETGEYQTIVMLYDDNVVGRHIIQRGQSLNLYLNTLETLYTTGWTKL